MPLVLQNIFSIALAIVIFYVFFKLLHSLFKSILIVLILIILVVLLKSMREPVEILGKYRVSNFKLENIK